MEKISVIICTYNPDVTIISRCLSHIEEAVQNIAPVDILLIDNNSNNGFDNAISVAQFIDRLKIRIIREPKQGLTNARLRGINEASGELLVFIDDDNLIAPDFLEHGIEVSKNYPKIGSWSGQVLLEFEDEPELWTRRYWGLLVHRELTSDLWSNLPLLPDTMPCGAGLFVRKHVAEYYDHLHRSGKRDIQLDRNGGSLFSGGDNDLAACACDLGLGVGLFHKLRLHHYIPSARMKKSYLLKLAEGIAASAVVLRNYRGASAKNSSIKTRIANILRLSLKRPLDRSFYQAVLKGERKGILLIQENEKAN